MTGEMGFIDQDGNDCNGDCYSTHAAIAKALNGTLKPFDVYQGPYISIGGDVRIGSAPYAIAPRLPGIVRLWLIDDEDGFCRVYNEDTEKISDIAFPYELEDIAILAAESVL